MRGYRHDGKITNIPLYLTGKMMELISVKEKKDKP